MNVTTIVSFVAVFAIVLGTALVLSRRSDWRIIGFLVVAGLILSLGKIWLFQQAPQWLNINSDSVTYNLNAQALMLHWQGEDVSTDHYNLNGLRALQKTVWAKDDTLPYSAVFGTSDWLYTGYVAAWYEFVGIGQDRVTFSNAVLAAFFSAAAFGITLGLGAARKVAVSAALITCLDPSSGVNAAWLLKDTLVGFFAMAALWAAIVYAKDRRGGALVILFFSMGLLGGSRYVAFVALAVALAFWLVRALLRSEHKAALAVTLTTVASVFLHTWLGLLPQAPVSPMRAPSVAMSSLVMPARGGVDILQTEHNTSSAEDATLRWKESLEENPLLSVTKSVAHTLFAPYPWVAIYPGLTWKSPSELYYAGVTLWMIMLPGILVAVVHFARRQEQPAMIVLVFLAALLAAYSVFLGEWSTRQRIFVLPVFFALGAIGWSLLLSHLKTRRSFS